MVQLDVKNRRNWLIAGVIAIFFLFALWLRLLPMFLMGKTDILLMVGSDDPLYNLRQVEQLLANNLNYAWFDPMSEYPVGTSVYWGPLFPTVIAICCMIFGAAARPEIISVGLVVPAVMGALVVPLMYYIGRYCGNWKTGLLAAGFTAIVSGQFFYRSFYGYMDHHIAEALFATLFCLLYIYTLVLAKDQPVDLKNLAGAKKFILFSFFAGIAYLLGLFTMPTMILFAMIVGIFTIIQFVIDVYRDRSSDYLLLGNAVIFITASIGLAVYGFKNPGLGLSTYSIGHIFAYIALIGGTALLYGIARFLKGKEKYYFPAAVAGCALIFAGILFVVNQELYNLLVYSFFSFFGQAPVTNTVQEARGWSLDSAWTTFNYGLILMIGGALVILYNNLKDERPHEIFTLVWSVVIAYSTWQHIRYEYYLAVNIALLSAICVSFVFERGWKDISTLASGLAPEKSSGTTEASRDESPRDKKQKKSQKKGPVSPQVSYGMIGLVVITAGLGILFVYTSASYSYINATSGAIQMNPDWRDTLEWMGNNTPDTGVDYFTLYNRETFEYPDTSYGVMSWWDYGHMITYIAKRIPNANPFQAGVIGPDGSAAYFVATSEDTANTILDHDGTRYVITDIEMDTGKFWAMATWFNATAGPAPYQLTMLAPGQADPSRYDSVLLNRQPYYHTMVSRLHNFDGSIAVPTAAYYVEYADSSLTNVKYPVITNAEAMNVSEAAARAGQFNAKAASGTHAEVMSPSVILPIDAVPALKHYRLVYESQTNVFTSKTVDLKYVKVFEYVKGAKIKGSGIIEVPLVTNTGRTFTYRQESVNGTFTVPYATSGSQYPVKTTGPYHIIGTKTTFEVSESAVIQGLAIN